VQRFILGLVCLLSLGAAEPTNVTQLGSQLSNVSLNATQTLTIPIQKSWAKVRVGVAYTYSAATTVVATPSCQQSTGGTYYQKTTRACTAGACAVTKQVDTYTTAGASANIELEYDVRGCLNFKVVFTAGGSPAAADKMTTQTVGIVGI
jgi:hypothetical protein